MRDQATFPIIIATTTPTRTTTTTTKTTTTRTGKSIPWFKNERTKQNCGKRGIKIRTKLSQ
jgi:hypothetical protein